ncbi:MAG TPA: ribonuclease HII [Candidatus Saccharimonadales bacterium]
MITVGIDEVGRGCWAGPLVAGAVGLVKPINGLDDSKKLSKFRRERLAAELGISGAAIGLGWVWPLEIDELGLTAAVGLAMRRALDQITIAWDKLIIDGNYNFFPDDPRAKAIIKADATVPAVSAASIVAKVARDQWMAGEATRQFPGYRFDKHVGYGTALHQAMLQTYGVCTLHRRSFKPIKVLLEQAT